MLVVVAQFETKLFFLVSGVHVYLLVEYQVETYRCCGAVDIIESPV